MSVGVGVLSGLENLQLMSGRGGCLLQGELKMLNGIKRSAWSGLEVFLIGVEN